MKHKCKFLEGWLKMDALHKEHAKATKKMDSFEEGDFGDSDDEFDQMEAASNELSEKVDTLWDQIDDLTQAMTHWAVQERDGAIT